MKMAVVGNLCRRIKDYGVILLTNMQFGVSTTGDYENLLHSIFITSSIVCQSPLFTTCQRNIWELNGNYWFCCYMKPNLPCDFVILISNSLWILFCFCFFKQRNVDVCRIKNTSILNIHNYWTDSKFQFGIFLMTQNEHSDLPSLLIHGEYTYIRLCHWR